MKSLRLHIVMLISVFLINSINLSAGKIVILGVSKNIDTLEHKSVGPGIQYTKFVLPDYPLSGYMLVVDLTNPYNQVETFQAQNQVGKTEAMSSAFNRLDREQHRTIAGVNGNFWIVSGQGQPDAILGVPHSGSAFNGEMITDPNNWNRGHGSIGFAMIDADKKAWIDDISFVGTVKIPGKSEYPVSQINRLRNVNELVLFNNFLGSKVTQTDDDGIEVFIKPVTGKKWEVNSEVECVVTRIVSNKGGNSLMEGETVLSGNGTASTFLNNLSTGDKLFVNMTVKTLTDNQFLSVAQMVTGNALVMKDGTLTNRNYNEAYNTQLYPRTGIGSSQDGKTLYLIVIDKGGKSAGASTETMCGILKACGAQHATSMDGGGSAQMMLDGQIVNNPSDGKERPVANGWFLFHNAQEDNVITRIEFANHQIRLPSYSSFTPVILGYNRFGVLVNKNVTGFTLSCSPEIGTIFQNNILVATNKPGTGNLIASINGVTATKSIEIVSGQVSLKCDSILMDTRNDYPIEVISNSAGTLMSVSPEFLSWEVKDPAICEVRNGILKGLKTGKTFVCGSLGEFKDTLLVRIEIPAAPSMIADSIHTADWAMTASTFLNAQWNTESLPQGWKTGSVVNFVHAAGRAPFIKLTNKSTLYGLPDTVKVIINIGDIALTKAIVSLQANNDTKLLSRDFTALEHNKDISLDIPVDQLMDVNNRATYPVRFDNVNFYIDAAGMTAQKSYSLAVKEVSLSFKDFVISYTAPEKMNMFKVYPNPAKDGISYIYLKLDRPEDVRIDVVGQNGQILRSNKLTNMQSGEVKLPLDGLNKGMYIVNVIRKQETESVKILLK